MSEHTKCVLAMSYKRRANHSASACFHHVLASTATLFALRPYCALTMHSMAHRRGAAAPCEFWSLECGLSGGLQDADFLRSDTRSRASGLALRIPKRGKDLVVERLAERPLRCLCAIYARSLRTCDFASVCQASKAEVF